MKLSVWAKQQGISYSTAYRWFHSGKMPCGAEQTNTGTILVHEKTEIATSTKNVVIYARVSSYERKGCLEGQAERCSAFANTLGLSVNKIYKEVASGMNDKRPKFLAMLETCPSHIVIENKDRLTRFGFNYLEVLLKKLGCEIIVLNRDQENETDLMKDLVSVITSFCCRLYGMRRGLNKAKLIKQELNK